MPSVPTGRLLRLVRQSSLPVRTFSTSKCRLEVIHKADEATLVRATTATRTNGRVALVDFYTNWCRPCKILSPILQKLASDPDFRTGLGRPIDLITVDSDVHRKLAEEKYDVSAVPTVVAFRGGEPVKRFVGVVLENGVREFLEDV